MGYEGPWCRLSYVSPCRIRSVGLVITIFPYQSPPLPRAFFQFFSSFLFILQYLRHHTNEGDHITNGFFTISREVDYLAFYNPVACSIISRARRVRLCANIRPDEQFFSFFHRWKTMSCCPDKVHLYFIKPLRRNEPAECEIKYMYNNHQLLHLSLGLPRPCRRRLGSLGLGRLLGSSS